MLNLLKKLLFHNSFKFYLLFYSWLRWVCVAMQTLLYLWQVRATLQVQCAGFPLQWPLLLWTMGPRACSLQHLQHVGSVAVAYRPSCSAARGTLLDWGIQPVFPASAGIFFTTEPPGTPILNILKKTQIVTI